MKITTIGRGNVGGGLARLWRAAGHDVTELGKEGGDASDADAVLVAVPSAAIDDALASVTGLEGKVVLDATNAFRGRSEEFESLAHQVKARTGGTVAKAFNVNFARIYDEIAKQESPPGNLYCAEDEALEVAEQLIRDAGFEPVNAGRAGARPCARGLPGAVLRGLAVARRTGVLPLREALVAEVAAAGEDHRRAGRRHRLDDLVVALRAAGLDHRRDTCVERELSSVGEGEERV